MKKIIFAFVMLCVLASFALPAPTYQLLVFEGSDWCASCRKLEKTVLHDSTFLGFLQARQIELVKVDFPQRKKLDKETKKHNEMLAARYEFAGEFPTVVLAKANSSLFVKINTAHLDKTQMMAELEAKIKLLP